MFAPRLMAGLALAIASLTPLSAAQQVDSIDRDTATLGDVIRVFGSDLGNKPKLVLVQDGELVKKTKTQSDLNALEKDVRQSFKVGKLNLVDLAGSERVRLSGATGQRLEESKKINQR